MALLAQFVDQLEFYRVSIGARRGLELPKECMTRSGRWQPWFRHLEGEMECDALYRSLRWTEPTCVFVAQLVYM